MNRKLYYKGKVYLQSDLNSVKEYLTNFHIIFDVSGAMYSKNPVTDEYETVELEDILKIVHSARRKIKMQHLTYNELRHVLTLVAIVSGEMTRKRIADNEPDGVMLDMRKLKTAEITA